MIILVSNLYSITFGFANTNTNKNDIKIDFCRFIIENYYIQTMTDTRNLLVNIVKEQGIVDMILDYKDLIEKAEDAPFEDFLEYYERSTDKLDNLLEDANKYYIDEEDFNEVYDCFTLGQRGGPHELQGIMNFISCNRYDGRKTYTYYSLIEHLTFYEFIYKILYLKHDNYQYRRIESKLTKLKYDLYEVSSKTLYNQQQLEKRDMIVKNMGYLFD